MNEMNDDTLSEKDFRTISYEDFPTAQLVDNAMISKRDSSTCTSTTNESKEFAVTNKTGTAVDPEDNLSCKVLKCL